MRLIYLVISIRLRDILMMAISFPMKVQIILLFITSTNICYLQMAKTNIYFLQFNSKLF